MERFGLSGLGRESGGPRGRCQGMNGEGAHASVESGAVLPTAAGQLCRASSGTGPGRTRLKTAPARRREGLARLLLYCQPLAAHSGPLTRPRQVDILAPRRVARRERLAESDGLRSTLSGRARVPDWRAQASPPTGARTLRTRIITGEASGEGPVGEPWLARGWDAAKKGGGHGRIGRTAGRLAAQGRRANPERVGDPSDAGGSEVPARIWSGSKILTRLAGST